MMIARGHAEATGGLDWPGGAMTDDEIADPQVIPYLFYADAAAVLEWLAHTFRFAVRTRDVRADGTVRHAERQLNRGGVVMLGSAGPSFRGPGALGGTTQLVRITVADLRDHRNRITAAGATASAIEIGPPGWISYSVTDPEGHQWYFTGPEHADR
jgi:uncharacterized glyoxalase superfamily protein PhnB